MAKANGVKWYGHDFVLRKDDRHVLIKVMKVEVKGKSKQGRPKKTWKTQVEKKMQKCNTAIFWRRRARVLVSRRMLLALLKMTKG